MELISFVFNKILTFLGIGYACVMVSTFGRAQGAAIRKGYAKDIETYLLISGKVKVSNHVKSSF